MPETFFWDRPKLRERTDRQIEVDESYFMKYVLVDFSEYWRQQDLIRKMLDKLNQEIENGIYGL